jgi:ATP-binding cassette subfamily F protein uup
LPLNFEQKPLNYLSVENISRSYGERVLFKEATFGLDRGQKMAFIAKNGTGKTSLLRILAGIEPPETGSVVFRSGIQVGYLEQEPELNPEHTVQLAVFDPTNTIMIAVREYEEAMLHLEDGNRFQAAFDRMDQLSAWDVEARVKEVLGKLNIHESGAEGGNPIWGAAQARGDGQNADRSARCDDFGRTHQPSRH